jgi:hypothetical protein
MNDNNETKWRLAMPFYIAPKASIASGTDWNSCEMNTSSNKEVSIYFKSIDCLNEIIDHLKLDRSYVSIMKLEPLATTTSEGGWAWDNCEDGIPMLGF